MSLPSQAPVQGCFLQNWETATLGFPFAQLTGSQGWEDADTIPGCLTKRGERVPGRARQEN